jgi:hypothetical protein
MAPSATPFVVAVVFSILYTKWRCMTFADVVGRRPDFIMADSCAAGSQAPGRRWVCAGLVARVLRRCPRTIAPVSRQESGRGREPHRVSFAPFWLSLLACDKVWQAFTPYFRPTAVLKLNQMQARECYGVRECLCITLYCTNYLRKLRSKLMLPHVTNAIEG